jgi:hypothetical protein
MEITEPNGSTYRVGNIDHQFHKQFNMKRLTKDQLKNVGGGSTCSVFCGDRIVSHNCGNGIDCSTGESGAVYCHNGQQPPYNMHCKCDEDCGEVDPS